MDIVMFRPDMQHQTACFFEKCFSAAQHLYLRAGFRETDRYNDNERAELYFELIL